METKSLYNCFPLPIHKVNSNPYPCNYHRDLESKISIKGGEKNSDLGFYKGHTHHHKTKSISAFLFLTFQIQLLAYYITLKVQFQTTSRPVQPLAAPLVCEGGPHLPNSFFLLSKKYYINYQFKLICFTTTLTWKKNVYVYLQKNILYTKLTYFYYPNKDVKHS